MTKDAFAQRLREGLLIADGATGSCLMAAGMPRGVPTVRWIETHPDVLVQLQRDYIRAGAQLIYAPTFHSNRICFEQLGLSCSVGDSVRAMVALSREAAAGTAALVAGNLGSAGVPPEPYGPLTYERMLDCYTEQIEALAGAGVDLLAAETLLAAEEALALLDAAAGCGLPVICTMTVEADGALLFGGNIFDAAADLEAMGAAAVGINCSVGPDQLESVVRTLCSRVSVPVAVKPNAGMPELTETGDAVYPMGPEAFAAHMCRLRDAGAEILGGCCGTTPDYIRALCAALAKR